LTLRPPNLSNPFLVMGYANTSWVVISAWATKDLAVTELDRIRWDVMTDHDRKNAKNPPTMWRFWEEKKPGYKSIGKNFPGRALKFWGANSIGGSIGKNPWLWLAVVELIVQGTVLDKIVEATS
jgi:hypothetical protein